MKEGDQVCQSAVLSLEEQSFGVKGIDEEQWAGEKMSYTQHPWQLGLTMHPLGAKDEHSGFIAAEERSRSKTNLWHRLYLGLYTFLGVKGFAYCPNRHGSGICFRGTREERETEFQL